MKIHNIEGLSATDLQQEAAAGARFVFFRYTISLLVVTLKRTSDVYMVRVGRKTSAIGWRYSLISILTGWWGIPFGPSLTLNSLRTNWKGGVDVTDEVMSTVAGHILFRESEQKKKLQAV